MSDFPDQICFSSVKSSCFSYCCMEGLGGLLSRLHKNVPGCRRRNLNFEAHMSTIGCRTKGRRRALLRILSTGFCEFEVHLPGTQLHGHTLPWFSRSIIPTAVSKTPSQKPSKDFTTFTRETLSEWGDCRVLCCVACPKVVSGVAVVWMLLLCALVCLLTEKKHTSGFKV